MRRSVAQNASLELPAAGSCLHSLPHALRCRRRSTNASAHRPAASCGELDAPGVVLQPLDFALPCGVTPTIVFIDVAAGAGFIFGFGADCSTSASCGAGGTFCGLPSTRVPASPAAPPASTVFVPAVPPSGGGSGASNVRPLELQSICSVPSTSVIGKSTPHSLASKPYR